MASNQPFKKKKVEYNVDQSTVDKILKKKINKKIGIREPKKTSWMPVDIAASIPKKIT